MEERRGKYFFSYLAELDKNRRTNDPIKIPLVSKGIAFNLRFKAWYESSLKRQPVCTFKSWWAE